MICKTYPLHTLEGSYKYVVILSQMNGHILLSCHKERTTWETQGGHIESGETPCRRRTANCSRNPARRSIR